MWYGHEFFFSTSFHNEFFFWGGGGGMCMHNISFSRFILLHEIIFVVE